MSACSISSQLLFTEDGIAFSLTRFLYNASSDTVAIPLGSAAAACLPVLDGTAPTVSLAQGAGDKDTATLTSGTAGKEYYLIARHTGGVIAR